MFKTRKGLLLIIVILFMTGAFQQIPDILRQNLSDPAHPETIEISDERRVHILYGDDGGGGHLHGVGKPCKSEFPRGWDEDKILSEVQRIAANDNLPWKKQGNGYFTAEDNADGIRVRVVLDRERDGVITAYPVNTRRNPCPDRKPANDNVND